MVTAYYELQAARLVQFVRCPLGAISPLKPIPVLVIEDNRLVREGIAAMLAAHTDLQVVAAVDGADEGLRVVQATKPQVVLVDAGLGDHDSHRLVASLKKAAPELSVIVMDLLPIPEDIVAFVKAGVTGFILKDATVEHFVRTVRSAALGEHVLPRALTRSLFSQIAEQARRRAAPEVIEAVRMTRREREVFRLIADGLSNKEIAHRIHVATNTVKGHVHNILKKLSLHTRLQIATYARGGDTATR